MRHDPDDLLVGLDDEQRAAVTTVRGPVRVLAGAGTGKTRMVTHRIAYAVATGATPASEVLAVTFTKRAAGELRDRLRVLGLPPVQAGTFHASALRQLSYFWPRMNSEVMPPLVDRRLPLVARAASLLLRRSLPQPDLRDLTGEIDWAKSSLVTPASYVSAAAAAGRVVSVPPADVAAVLEAYEKVKGEAVDFDDLLRHMADVLLDSEVAAAEFRSRYTWITVDEYQDTSPAQQRLLDSWLGNSDELCVVGDVAQTIYGFAGADADYLIDFARRFPHAANVRLVRDYRSTPQVVEVANRVLAGASGPYATLKVTLVGQQPPGPKPRIQPFADDASEADAVAARCRELLSQGVSAGEIAVLVRTNAHAEAFEEALDRAKVPHVVRGGVSFFEREDVRAALRALRAAAAEGGADAPATEAVPRVLAAAGHAVTPPAGSAARDRWDAVETLRRIALESGPTLGDSVRELTARAASRHTPAADAVTVATLHSTKGLEWDAVFVVGVSEGRLPIRYAESPAAIEEERRLLYVGVTRARTYLWISWSRRPSRFLDGLYSGGAGTARGRTGHSGAPKAPDSAQSLSPADRALFEELRAWRLGVAREANTPAFTVFTDSTLAAFAAARPRTPDALLSVRGVGPAKVERYGSDILRIVSTTK